MQNLESRALPLHIVRAGEGPRFLFLHAAASSSAAFRPLAECLGHHGQILMPDLLGEGRSPAPKSWDHLIDQELSALHASLLDSDWPCVVVGHSYGGVLAMELARRSPTRVLGLVLIEPVAFHLLRDHPGHREVGELGRLRDRCVAWIQADRLRDAATLFVDYWSGTGTFAALPASQQTVLSRAMLKVTAGWSQIAALPVPREAYASIDVPALVVRGTSTREPMRWIATQLASTLPQAQLFDVVGASHNSPMTHPNELAWLLQRWMPVRAGSAVVDELAFRDTVV